MSTVLLVVFPVFPFVLERTPRQFLRGADQSSCTPRGASFAASAGAEKAHSGSYLLRDPDRMGRIIERVVAACAPTPVTAKIRRKLCLCSSVWSCCLCLAFYEKGWSRERALKTALRYAESQNGT